MTPRAGRRLVAALLACAVLVLGGCTVRVPGSGSPAGPAAPAGPTGVEDPATAPLELSQLLADPCLALRDDQLTDLGYALTGSTALSMDGRRKECTWYGAPGILIVSAATDVELYTAFTLGTPPPLRQYLINGRDAVVDTGFTNCLAVIRFDARSVIVKAQIELAGIEDPGELADLDLGQICDAAAAAAETIGGNFSPG